MKCPLRRPLCNDIAKEFCTVGRGRKKKLFTKGSPFLLPYNFVYVCLRLLLMARQKRGVPNSLLISFLNEWLAWDYVTLLFCPLSDATRQN